ncbi:hypothetical protein D3C80_1175800 [compost metagenome]
MSRKRSSWRVDCHVTHAVASAHDRRPRHFRPVLPFAELASGRDLVPPSLAARLPDKEDGRRHPCYGAVHDRPSLQVRLPQDPAIARLHPPGDPPGGAGRGRLERDRDGLHRLRRHGAQPARRQPDPDHDAAPPAAGRAQARRPDGRRHDQGRRPDRQGRLAPATDRRDDPGQHRLDQDRVREVPDLRRRPVRRRHGRQQRLAVQVRLRRVPARLRHAFHGQPDAELRLGQAAPRARAADDLPRVQLHADAVGGLPGAEPLAERDAADGRLGPVGQHHLGRRSGAPRRSESLVRSDHAPADHGLGRQDGQDGPGRHLAERRTAQPL